MRDKFNSIEDFDIYLVEQKIRMEKGYLTRSEREVVKKMLDKNYKPTIIKEEKPKLSIITNIDFLKQPCQEINKEDNVVSIIKKLKDTLENVGGLGISANQIDIQKRISYIKIPKVTKDKKLEFNEYILINAKIIEKDRPIRIKNEGCLSFPGIDVTTKRFVFITVEYLNEKMELRTGLMQDLEALVIQHECDHQAGVTILDRKWRSK